MLYFWIQKKHQHIEEMICVLAQNQWQEFLFRSTDEKKKK